MKHFPVSNFLIVNQFTIIYNYFLIVFDQTKTTLSIFFNNWVTRRKRNIFCKKSSVLVYGVEYCIKIYLYLYNLYSTNVTYRGISLWLNLSSLGKAYGLWYLNEAMISDSFAFTKARAVDNTTWPLCAVDDILEVVPCGCRVVNQEWCKENIYNVAIIKR